MNSNLKSQLKELTLASTMHGIPNYFRANLFILRFIWMILISASIGTCGYFIAEGIENYLAFDKVTNINVFIENPLVFPTVTICNINSRNNLKNYSLTEMLLYCRYDYTSCSSRDFINIKLGSYNCFSLNSGRNLSGDAVELYKGTRIGWLNGIRLRLFAGFENETSSFINGFLVFIHNSSMYPFFDTSLQVSTGQTTDFIVTKIIDTQLGEPYNSCKKSFRFDDNGYIPKFLSDIMAANYSYTQNLCLFAQLQQIQSNYCNCSIAGYNRTEEYNDCTNVSVKCLEKAYNSIFLKYLNTYVNTICPEECDKYLLKVTVSSNPYPISTYLNELRSNAIAESNFSRKSLNLSKTKESVANIRIFFADYTYIGQTPKTTLADAVSSLGGTLGLFLGISFLSFFEILDFLVIWFDYNINSGRFIKPMFIKH